MITKRDAGDSDVRVWRWVRGSWMLFVAVLAAGLATGVRSAAAATSVQHPHSHTSVQWWVPFLIALVALAVILLLVRTVQVRRRH